MRCSALAISLLLLTAARPAGQVAAPASGENSRPAFSEFLERMKEQARANGVGAATIDAALNGLEPLEIVVERDRTQAETVLTIDQYLQRRLTRRFVRSAVDQARKHRRLLAEIEKKYEVPGSVIVAIWGMESNFGGFTGTRPIIQALATLA
jgi:membrane-bound lytic murein transglycosylase B